MASRSWRAEVIFENPFGVCLSNLPTDIYLPSAHVYGNPKGWATTQFVAEDGTRVNPGRNRIAHDYTVSYLKQTIDLVRRTYNLSEDTEVSISRFGSPGSGNSEGYLFTGYNKDNVASNADSVVPEILTRMDTGEHMFQADFRQEIGGTYFDRTVNFNYDGETQTFYNLQDVINFWAVYLNVEPSEFETTYIHTDENDVSTTYSNDEIANSPWPGFGCNTEKRTTIVNLEDNTSSTISVEFDFSPRLNPSEIPVTIIDGDPPLTELGNGDGSIVISDNGNISMSNDGGTFFMNEYGNAGFFANNDVSLTANTQVQLGAGSTSLDVNNTFTFRDDTGVASLTAAEINRLKELLGE